MLKDYKIICDKCRKTLDFWEARRCPICGRDFCSDCFEGTEIKLEDFEFKHLCRDCITPEIEELIREAQKTQDVLYNAEREHCAACDRLFECITEKCKD